MESRKRKMLQDRGTLPKEECDVIREYQAMHEENFVSSWLREDGKDKKETWRYTGDFKKNMGKKKISEEEKEENETVIVKRRCVSPVSTAACEELKGEVWLEPIQAELRRKTSEASTDEHRQLSFAWFVFFGLDFFQATDVPALVMPSCKSGATPASQIPEQ